MLEAIKWGSDYLLSAHIVDPLNSNNQLLVAQVGDLNQDHSAWTRPEDFTMARPVSVISPTRPGSDLAGDLQPALHCIALQCC